MLEIARGGFDERIEKMNVISSKLTAFRNALARHNRRPDVENGATNVPPVEESKPDDGGLGERDEDELLSRTKGSVRYRTFIMEVDGLWVTSRAEWDCVVTGHHASATIPDEDKPHSIFISTEADELGYDIPFDPHGLGYQLCETEDLIVIKVDEPTINLMRPGAQFEVTLCWSTRDDNDYNFFSMVQMELVFNRVPSKDQAGTMIQ